MTYRIVITGSRTWTDKGRLWDCLDDAVYQSGYELRDVILVHGACPRGADAMADEWAQEYAIKAEPHPADWREHGRRAGFLRNAHMVGLGADLCLAFINPCTDRRCHQPGTHGTHGATHCANAAERAGIPTRKYTP
ncbi:MAG TPA: DUF2493 domain-containing protein [Streptosporangiaceae bacterium]|jgi:hypothetical protein|nr:DUF2493 domain-containing protein [Streptosporangiaceae bacterium]